MVGAVSVQRGVSAKGTVTISADRLPKRPDPAPEGSPSSEEAVSTQLRLPRTVWIALLVSAVVVAVIVLSTR